MMPRIYRGKSPGGGFWYEGFYIEKRGEYSGEDVSYIHSPDGFNHEVDPQTVGVFTGLFDAHSMRIFENDIIQNKAGETGYVTYDRRTCRFVIMYHNHTDGFDDCRAHEMTVIGNRTDDENMLYGKDDVTKDAAEDAVYDGRNTPEDILDTIEAIYCKTVSENFGKRLANKCRDILQHLHTDPYIHPTPYNTVEFEFNRSDGSILTFEVFTGRTAWSMVLEPDHRIQRGNLCASESRRIDMMVEDFYKPEEATEEPPEAAEI